MSQCLEIFSSQPPPVAALCHFPPSGLVGRGATAWRRTHLAAVTRRVLTSWLLLFGSLVAAAAGPAVTGIDVSRHGGAVDWEQVAEQGHAFAFIKSTEGVDLEDTSFRENWRGAAAAGLARGAYHFYVTEDDPVEQAAFFLDTVDHVGGDLVPVVDVERVGHGTRPGWQLGLRSFLEVVERELGTKPLIYTSPHFWDEEFGAAFGKQFSDFPLWVAEYEVDAPLVPEGFGCWLLWQFAGDVQVPGVEVSADVSRLHPGCELPRVPER